MSRFVPFSKRQKSMPDTYQYDEIPEKLRIQVLHIWNDMWPNGRADLNMKTVYPGDDIEKFIKKEHGILSLSKQGNYGINACQEYLYTAADPECIDIIEYSFRLAEYIAATDQRNYPRPMNPLDDVRRAINDLNYRFRENGVGYQFESSQLVRIDSQLVHTEVTQPALMFLSGKEFCTANEQFLMAHKYYREGNLTDAMQYCRKSFESVMKCICTARNFSFDDDKDTASKLVNVLFTNKFFPPMLESYFANLKGLLESAAPIVVPNKRASHGPAPTTPPLTEELASFTMHQIASIIIFMVKIHRGSR